MVNIEDRLEEIRELVDKQNYFVMNRARQYGKTTTIHLLKQKLETDYTVLSLSFEGMGNAAYEGEHSFCQRLYGLIDDAIYYKEVTGFSDFVKEECGRISRQEPPSVDFRDLSNFFSKMCQEAEKPVVLVIDEVDQASNQEIFLSFLGMLRNKYLNRKNRPAFQSVILAGVYDIKNLKLKIRKDEEHQYNSPWNIAARFDVDMSFSVKDIEGMLAEYEQEYQTGMDLKTIAQLIYDYTSGYPFLVSCICKIIDEQISRKSGWDRTMAWMEGGVLEAVKELLKQPNTLFDDMRKKIAEYPELRRMLYGILFQGKSFPYNPDNHAIDIGNMFGFVKDFGGIVAVANRIFETRLYNLFLSEEVMNSESYQAALMDKNQFVQDGFLNMDLVLKKFVEHFTEVYGDSTENFIEENGRRFFLLYLKPIINGVGNYYIEARTRDMKRTDVIVDYRGKQYIVEMKIWHGDEYNRRGEKQLVSYLEDYHQTKGYMLSFNFNKKKKVGVKEISCDGKHIIEAVV